MSYDNLRLKGESNVKGHLDWIDLVSAKYWMIDPVRGYLRITKWKDKSSLKLIQEWLTSSKPGTVAIHFLSPDVVEPYLKYVLTGAYISECGVLGGDEPGHERFFLYFDNIEVTGHEAD